MILQKVFDQDELLLHLSFVSFDRGLYDSVILDYLCEHFNGTVDQMYRVLKAGVAEHVETYDLEERLLAQMRSCARVPVLTRAGAVRGMNARAQALFALESRAADLYSLAYPDLRAAQGGRAWRDGPVLL